MMQRSVADVPPLVEVLTRMCGDFASRSTETVSLLVPIPMIGCDCVVPQSLAAGIRVMRDRIMKEARAFLHIVV
ncbi:hypothetical protein ACFV2N_47760, partial [Streptomyces sp. NPDC059680]|uniref:hypothetical protein n=1 Tax=Streptomyces sp. NPDC059680 TaxID=3346904 RepID=UPI003687433D